MEEAYTYDDVLLVPQRTSVESRKDVDLSTQLTRKIKINIPIVSANMDAITEAPMAIAMARLGGVGIIHRFLTIEDQVAEIAKVKKSDQLQKREPYLLRADDTVSDAKRLMHEKRVKDIVIVDESQTVKGFLTLSDIIFEKDNDKKIVEVMTGSDDLVTANEHTNADQARALFQKHKFSKLPIVDAEGKIKGIIMRKDLLTKLPFLNSSLDTQGRLRVGAAIGVKDDAIDRAQALLAAGTDFLVIDIAHGHSESEIAMLKNLKKNFPDCQVMAGNVATAKGTADLIAAGADAIKVGVGPGAVCTTRIVSGSGYPQLSAVLRAAKVAKEQGVPINADGGIKASGDIVKALAAGAHSVMLGSILAGTEEVPGSTHIRDGKKFKIYRGMASLGANMGKAVRQDSKDSLTDYVPEGVEAIVPYRGHVQEVMNQLLGGIRSGFSYCGSHNLQELHNKAEFVRITPASLRESSYHDVQKL